LRALGRGVWSGRVEPLPNRLRMSLYVARDANGSVSAFLRDPLFNFGRNFQTMAVDAYGGALQFSGGPYPIEATFDGANTLTLSLHGVPPLRFVRRSASAAPATYAYREPLATGDGWQLGAAADAGFRTAALEQLFIANGAPPTSAGSPDVHAILVARHGKLVVDQYFDGFDATMLHDTRSATKTYADVLVGAAQQAGVALDGDTPLLPLFATYGTLANPDPRKAKMTLGDALSMSTGLDCDDFDEHSAGNEVNVLAQTAQPDWYRLVLETRMVRDPGTKAVYCGAGINLAGGAVTSATHTWLPLFFASHVAEPLEMQGYALNLTPSDNWYVGNGAYVRPRDFLKIGQLFLDGGTWNGTRVVPRAWIERSWDAHLSLAPGDGYGYGWHVHSYTIAGTTYRTYAAEGNGGQILDVIPQLDLVIMITEGNYNDVAAWVAAHDAILTRIIGAIEH
jgi:CubicO group peptidase (beta-lactamase class C family)